MEMMDPQTVELEGSESLSLFPVSSVVGAQMVASPRLEQLRHRFRGGGWSSGEGSGNRDMCTLLEKMMDVIQILMFAMVPITLCN